ncbi:uncharacterized protein K02A2.6-like [Ornithodoros turicata]|uniref:uncharacterized protein K02A2.6-like n=1 Tax=Ornithodoros turicata TaxID=34597 RepID=UPI00313A29AA
MAEEENAQGTQSVPANFFNPLSVQLPEKFDFRHPHSWKTWFIRWERYRIITELHLRPQETQVNTFLYAMGREGEDILCSLKLTPEQNKSYAAVTTAFEKHFEPRVNVIYERAKFNRRRQESHETVDVFITDLHKMADRCQYGELKEQLIRDRLVVGLSDVQLSERLQLNPELTLETAVTAARNSETVKLQQKDIRAQDKGEQTVDEVRAGRTRPRQDKKKTSQSSTRSCGWCGNARPHKRPQCPAHDKICNNCKKKGHFASVCKSSQFPKTPQKSQPHYSAALEEIYVGEVLTESSSEPWRIQATVGGRDITFKVDTGADVSVIPQCLYSKEMGELKYPTKVLLGPGQNAMNTLGQVKTIIKWRHQTVQEEVFVVTGLREALLGRPGIKALEVLKHLHEVSTTPSGVLDAKEVLKDYPKLLSGLGLMKTPYKITLLPEAKPYAVTYPRRVPIPLLPNVENELKRMQELGVIVRIDRATEWCAPMVVARKRDGELRICIDYTELNRQIVRERVLMPTVEESLARLSEAQIFSKLDARAGYWQAPLARESQEYTTFLTPFGRFQFQRLPFGISTAPEFFQREMHRILEGLEGQACLQDDIIVFGRTKDEHDQNLQRVLSRLQNAGITLNTKKCAFSRNEVKFLGHIVSDQGIKVDPEKLKAVIQLRPPQNVSEVRSFLGMVNHLAKFLPGLAEQSKPLRDLLRQDAMWQWGDAQQRAFDHIKESLTKTPVLVHYNPREPHTLSVDASSYGLGAVLLQETQGQRRPVAYASRALTETEQRYAQIEKEALAITWASSHFRTYLLGLRYHIETDHKPLVPLLTSKRIDQLSPRLQRFRMRLSEFDFSVSHVPGKDMHTADVLSRSPLVNIDTEATCDLEEAVSQYEVLTMELLPASADMLTRIKTETAKDPTLSRVVKHCSEGWPDQKTLPCEERRYAECSAELCVVEGLLFKGDRMVIPSLLRKEVLSNIHAGHQGVSRCRARARTAIWWPSIGAHIEDFVRRCSICQEHRKPGRAPLLLTPLPERPWEEIGMDLFTLQGENYLVIVDYYSRFFELIKLKATTTTDVIRGLKPIFARFGVPDVVRSDNGPQFASAEFRAFMKEWNILHRTSSPYYAQSNGAAERTVQLAKQFLTKTPEIEQALMAHRATPGPEGYTPTELLMGRKIKTNVPAPAKSLEPHWHYDDFRARNRQYREGYAKHYNRRYRAQEREPLQPDSSVKILVGTAAHGKIVKAAKEPRSYVVETTSGLQRRTQSHLQPLEPKANWPVRTCVQEPRSGNGTPKRTRGGRTVRPPVRLNL